MRTFLPPFPAIALCFFALLACGACSPTLYIPNTLNTPMLGHRGDFRGAFGYGAEGNFNLQTAYAVTDHAALMLNTTYLRTSALADITRDKHNFFELGYGRYAAFWPNRQGHLVGRVNVFGGAGIGGAADEVGGGFFSAASTTYRGKYQRLFLQPNFGIRTGIFDATVGVRTAWVNFSHFSQSVGAEPYLPGKFGFLTLEPTLTLSLGYRYIKFYVQVGATEALINRQYFDKVAGGFNQGDHSDVGMVFSPWGAKRTRRPKPVVREESPTPPPPATEEPVATVPHLAPDTTSVSPAAPTLLIGARQRTLAVCVRDNGAPDGDIIAISFRGGFVLQETELGRSPQCIELELWPDDLNLLFIHSLSSGRFKPNTVLVTVQDGSHHTRHLLQLEEGRIEQIRFELSHD